MKNLKAGDIIVSEGGKKAKVIDVLPNSFLRSCWGDFEEARIWHKFTEAEKHGWMIKGEETIIIVGDKKYKLIEE